MSSTVVHSPKADWRYGDEQRDKYSTYAELAEREIAGRDYKIRVIRRPNSKVAILAPHGGSIERRTSCIATAIAGKEFNLYLFEGLDADGSFDTLHITSHRFNEPSCLNLIANCAAVVAVHGFSGETQEVMLGGLDENLKRRMGAQMALVGIDAKLDEHPYPGLHANNICNRGQRAQGIQLELSDGLRGGADEAAVIQSVRSVLLNISNEF